MKLIKLKKIVQIERKPFFITRQKLKLFRIVFNIIFVLMLFYYWSAIPLLLPRLIVVIFLLGSIFLTNKAFIAIKKRIGKTLFIRERLWYILESLKLYDSDGDRILNTAILTFDISNDNAVTISAPLFGDKWTKRLKNLEDNLVAGLGLPLLSKKELPNCVIYQLGHIEEIEQYVFNNNLTRKFFQSISSPVIKLSNTQQFSLKSNTNIGVYGRTGTGKTIALQWFLFNALAKGCGTDDSTYLGIVDGKGADLYSLGKLLQEELGEQIAIGSSPQMLAKLSREFVDIMNARFEVIKQNSSLNADAYDLEMTPNFLFVDELASIRDSCGSSKQGKELWNEILQNLGLIARKGRQAGCHLLLSTQDPNAENIPVELRNQISAVLYLGNPGADRLKMAFSMCDLENVPTVSDRKGEALFHADGLNSIEPVLTIVPFVDVKTKQDFLQIVRKILPNY
ncbi:cell division protein FtsK [Streptococcus azizii]|uniref:Cell division protein FtsK n=1 Tax=Streptococcus azizii TaxID=1579424 RepID=A0AB36JQL3_9STRE|nr:MULTISPECIES: FtsK/SpoIIIE domain-containing protein [Streptococcus]MBF0776585.1 cell division protein FtsK [Streptococcus sp. 19428wD3_AN2]ONK26152.1 cell division protein FtsK [Streptococcus azizii]ONK26651.1 cell division protein FtsK [Streptococcus azizii]ONK27562.1 cell division protein FtsK [Streptococcus azizii]TFU82682.1 cell division protein FtsK [Streptococcus sp. AN2]